MTLVLMDADEPSRRDVAQVMRDLSERVDPETKVLAVVLIGADGSVWMRYSGADHLRLLAGVTLLQQEIVNNGFDVNVRPSL